MKKLILTILFLLTSTTSCSLITYKEEKKLTPFPVQPAFPKVENPITGKQDDNYVVKPDFVKRSMLLQEYLKNIIDWKKLNNVE